jgi:hypothetical protein
MSIHDEIGVSNQLCDKMQNLIVTRGDVPSSERNMLLMGLWSFVFEIHRGIICLMSNQFFGAAQALVRTLVETTIRAHVVIMGSEEDVKLVLADNYKTRFTTIGKEIDAVFKLGGLFENFLFEARDALHSYNHVGMMQLSRRFVGTELAPNYPEGELVQTVNISVSACYMVNNLVTKHLGFEAEWGENSRMYEEWGKRDVGGK